ncbi:MAG: amidohydrolase family protein [Caulobacteraceae bacterium]|nr:amidohydrolase family protein [Caulobacteraceae bacterium]
MKRLRAWMLAGAAVWLAASPARADPMPAQSPHRGDERGGGLPLVPTRKVTFDTDEATWASLDVSPDGRTIVFDLLGDLYAVDAAGGTARPVATGMAFEGQPAFSPDGAWIAFTSDRSGAENVWIARPDGAAARQISHNDGPNEYVSPAWSADGRQVYASLYRSDRNAIELWRFGADGAGPGQELTGGRYSALGAKASPDGRWLYFAAHDGPVFEDDVTLPLWAIHRLDLKTGADETVVTNQGGAMRPVLSPDGRLMAYAVRLEGQTALRLRDLSTGADRLLAYPVQRDDQEALPSRDLEPGYAFTPDGKALLAVFGGKIHRIGVATGKAEVVPFTAHVDLDVGPFLRLALKTDDGPVRARLIQQPAPSPDGRRLAFSALEHLYLMDLTPGAAPRRLTADETPQFMPNWSPDGRAIAYVSWTAREGGFVWSAPADGRGAPKRLTEVSAYYTNPVFAPDGRTILALRSSAYDRLHMAQEPLWTGRSFGGLRQAELVELPAGGGPARVIASGLMSGDPQFVAAQPGQVFVNTDKGLERVALDGSGRRETVLSVVGPGYYFIDHPTPPDELRISPDGRWALAQDAQQLHLLAMPPAKDAGAPVDLSRPGVAHRKLTSVGADFIGWSDGGRSIDWTVGSTFYRRPLAQVALDAPGAPTRGDRPVVGQAGVEAFTADVEVPRDVPHGAVVLRGASVITLKGDQVIPDADVVVTGARIAAVGPRGQVAIPAGAVVRDVSGRFITPGFIDVHDHFGEVRRGVLDTDDWGMRATLAYGVTTAFDPSTLSIDMLAYQDLLDAGRMLGPRLYSTATAVFSFNDFRSLDETRDVLSRYVDHYRIHNLKEYRTGDRQVRQWVAMASRDLGLMPTTEGALDMKLDLTQVQDGYSGNEHSLSAVPLYRDVVQLFAQTRVSYDLTLEISHGGPPAGESFIAANAPLHDPKVRRFYPPYVAERLYSRVHWVDAQESVYPEVAASIARIQRAGGVVGIGSHGNYPGIGYDWELQAMASGGMTPAEVLRAATLGSAETIGHASEIGSLEPGKFADLVILARNPLTDIRNVASVVQVMKNGRLYDAASLDEVWPAARPAPAPWFADDDQPPAPDPALSR